MATLIIVGVAACSSPTRGPTVRIDESGWSVNPPTIVQPAEWFTFEVVNSLPTEVRFVVLQMRFGSIEDLPLVDGVVDVTEQMAYESDDPTVPSPMVVAYYVVYPTVEGEGAPGWEPATVAPGSSATVRVGNRGSGGGEPGRFAVLSYEPAGIEAGHFAIFDLTDENGQIPDFEAGAG